MSKARTGLFSLIAICAVFAYCGCKPPLINPFSIKQTLKTNIVASCAVCGKPGQVFAFTSNAMTAINSNNLMVFCGACAVRGIRELKPCSELTIAVAAPAQAVRIRREYKILEVDSDANKAKVAVVSDGRNRTQSAAFLVRHDSIPVFARKIGATFVITGVPEELAYFEGTGQ